MQLFGTHSTLNIDVMLDHWYIEETSNSKQLEDFGWEILTQVTTHLRYTINQLLVFQCQLAGTTYQTAVINVMWFEDSYAVSDNIKCYPSPTTLNT